MCCGDGARQPVLVTVILGGGRSSRMGTDKLGLRIDGHTLLERAVAAGLGWGQRVIVAGPQPPGWQPDPRVGFVVEDPPFGGPVAGLAAAMAQLADADEVLLLAGDLACPARVVSVLSGAALGADGVIGEDIDGWAQYLAGRYRAASIRRVLSQLPTTRDSSVRRALGSLDLHRVVIDRATSADLDTPDDAKIAGAIACQPEF